MHLRMLSWRAYGLARDAAKRTPLTRWSLGSSTLGQTLSRVSRWLLWKAVGPVGDVPVQVGGHRMCLTGWENGVRPFVDLLVGHYEEETTELVERLLEPGMTVVDAGAHVGYYTLLAARCVGPTGRVYAFEPEPENYAVLKKNLELNGYRNVWPLPKALSDTTGPATLFVSGRGTGTHSLFPHSGNEPPVRLPVEATTLDDFLRARDLTQVDLIKLDIEGGEPAALRGMQETLARSPHVRLIVELSPGDLATSGCSPQAFIEQLRRFGLRIFVLRKKGPQRIESVDLERLLTELAGDRYVNLLCEKQGQT